jgi:hypothetical protein
MVRVSLASLEDEIERPREEYLLLKDDSAPLEARNLDDLVIQLRERYPDAQYERTLHWERAREAEQRRAQAMQGLMKIFAEAAVQEMIEAHEKVAAKLADACRPQLARGRFGPRGATWILTACRHGLRASELDFDFIAIKLQIRALRMSSSIIARSELSNAGSVPARLQYPAADAHD